jgi:hypothetical protein
MGPDFQRGTIRYLSAGQETGREWFEMIRHPNGRTLRAFCEMDDVGLSRDVSIALDPASRPLDAFVRVIKNGQIIGTTLFLLTPDHLETTGRLAASGRLSQRQRLGRPLAYLGLHPLVGDALIATARGTHNQGEFLPIAAYTNSQSPAGEEGLYAMPVTIQVAYQGTAPLEVAAGDFEARRYALRWKPEWPPATLWVHGEDALFLRLDWPMLGVSYELTEHQITR